MVEAFSRGDLLAVKECWSDDIVTNNAKNEKIGGGEKTPLPIKPAKWYSPEEQRRRACIHPLM